MRYSDFEQHEMDAAFHDHEDRQKPASWMDRPAAKAKPRPTPEPECVYCGERPATCIGAYEGGDEALACDECCGHGCEDGKCVPICDASRLSGMCYCPAYSRPHDHEWTGDEPVEGEPIPCEHEWLTPHPRLGDCLIRCKYCPETQEMEE